jgi:hypothetical protein
LAAKSAGLDTPWQWLTAKDGRTYFFNKQTKESVWIPPADINSTLLTLAEVQAVIEKVYALLLKKTKQQSPTMQLIGQRGRGPRENVSGARGQDC